MLQGPRPLPEYRAGARHGANVLCRPVEFDRQPGRPRDRLRAATNCGRTESSAAIAMAATIWRHRSPASPPSSATSTTTPIQVCRLARGGAIATMIRKPSADCERGLADREKANCRARGNADERRSRCSLLRFASARPGRAGGRQGDRRLARRPGPAVGRSTSPCARASSPPKASTSK